MLRRGAKLFGAAMLSLVVLYGVNKLWCYINVCVEDDAARIASDLLGPLPEVLYIAATMAIVLPASLWLTPRLGLGLSVALTSLGPSYVIACALHSPPVHGSLLKTMLLVVPAFAVPWAVGAITLHYMWPNKSLERGREG